MLNQEFDATQFEIIVVNDSGKPLSGFEWETAVNVQIIHTNQRERSFARNAGAAIACGQYLCFLDDDDWWAPQALHHLWEVVAVNPVSSWVYGGVIFVNNDDQPLGEMNMRKDGNCFVEAMAETWIPIQASLIKTNTFFSVGGFNPDFLVTQDLDLLRRISLSNDLAHTPRNVTYIRRGQERGSVTRYSEALTYIRRGRNLILDQPGSFRRLCQGAANSKFLHGLILRIYLTAARENLRRKEFFKMARQLILACLILFLSIRFSHTRLFREAILLKEPIYYRFITSTNLSQTPTAEWLK